MLIVLLIICIILYIIGVYLQDYSGCDAGIIPELIGGFGGAITIIAMLVCIGYVAQNSVIDDKITMYTQENQVIEEQVKTIVEKYADFETDTFTKLKPESAIILISTYPQLKTNTLVTKQIDLYIKNNNTIKQLKIEKLNNRVNKWWLYFGK